MLVDEHDFENIREKNDLIQRFNLIKMDERIKAKTKWSKTSGFEIKTFEFQSCHDIYE